MARYDISKLGINLKKMRFKKGVEASAVADFCEMGVSTIFTLERGEFNPRLETLIRLMEYYECTFEDLCRKG